MSTTLRALQTLALERGRADAGQIFQLYDKTAAAELVAAGLAELVKADPAAELLDAPGPVATSSLSIGKPAEKEKEEKEKEEKTPAKTKEDKPTLKTK